MLNLGINEWLLRSTGIGEDAFVLNVPMAEGQSILDFGTLHATWGPEYCSTAESATSR